MAEPFTALIMAAGHGTRMRSDTPKVLHLLCGKPMIEWVVDSAREAGATRVVAIVRPGDGVAEGLPDGVEVAEQREGEGTGSAVLAARDHAGADPVVVLSGDQPLVTAALIADLVATQARHEASATLLTTDVLDPAGYGRIVRDADGEFERIVETKYSEEVPADQLAIREINLGTYVFDAAELFSALDEVGGGHGERYLTGVLPLLRERGRRVVTHLTGDATSAVGVNDRADLMAAEDLAQRRILAAHAREGVTFLAPASIRVEAGVSIAADATIAPGVCLLGATSVGAGATIGPQTTLADCEVGAQAAIVHTFATQASVEAGATVGPFAYLRPGTVVGAGAKVGTFVEVKNSDIGAGAKVPHLSYIGDADVGEGANLGASTITANYDGRRKHRTKVGKSAKTGIHTSLVAPVDVGERAYTGAGSVITEDVPEGALGIARSKQSNVEGYADRVEEDSQ